MEAAVAFLNHSEHVVGFESAISGDARSRRCAIDYSRWQSGNAPLSCDPAFSRNHKVNATRKISSNLRYIARRRRS